MKGLKVVLGLGICAGLLFFFAAPATAVEEGELVLITCPAFIYPKVVLDWPDKIGKDPTFHARSDKIFDTPSADFTDKSRDGQKLSCRYKLKGEYHMPSTNEYHYTVKRKIKECKNKDLHTWECVLEK